MAESLLAEQIRRIRKMTDQMSWVEKRREELSNEIARERENMQQGPIEKVRDVRPARARKTFRRRR